MRNIIITCLLLALCFTVKAQMSLSLPLDRSVFQRNSSGQATITIAGQVRPGGFSSSSFSIKYRVYTLDKNGSTVGSPSVWSTGSSSTPYAGVFSFSNTYNTGWYLLEVGAFVGSSTSPDASATLKFGIGEVIFIAGQSNAQGTDAITNSSVEPTFYDCVNSISNNQICKNTYQFPYMEKIVDGKIITPAGNQSAWAYGRLGKRIADELVPGTVVPTLFFNTAFIATSIEAWKRTARDPTKTAGLTGASLICCQETGTDWASEGAAGQPYKTLKNSLNYFGAMFGARTVLWHQGEADTQLGTTASAYTDSLKYVIDKSRTHFSTNLGWAISRASYNVGIKSNKVKAGQDAARIYTPALPYGARYSDTISAADRRPSDNTHFIHSGLQKLADQYFTSYKDGFTGPTISAIKNTTPVQRLGPPSSISVTKSGATVTLTAPSGYTYKWVENDGKITTYFSTARTITVSNSSWKSYRCYITDGTEKITISQAIYTPMLSVGGAARMSAEELAVSEEEEYVPLVVSPNPTKDQMAISFSLRDPANVSIELLDLQGRAIALVPEKSYGIGKHSSSLVVSHLERGQYICRLKAGDYFVSKKVILTP